jgi:hypothetical protein
MKKGKFIAKWVLAAILFVLLFGALTMVLWNWLVPSLFNGPHIVFVQALGLLLLAKILFGGWGGRHRCGNGGGHWRHRYFEKYSTMTPEEKERFKERLREKWCHRPPAAEEEKRGDAIV